MSRGAEDAVRVRVPTPDGRTLDAVAVGADDAPVVVFHSGTPGGPVVFSGMSDAAAANGLRLVTYGRPGYGDSDAQPGRTVADAATDTGTVLDHLGVDRFVTFGASGGGPHALATAALLPDRCLAAATVAGVAPYDAEGLDWLAGMADENVEEFGLTVKGADALTPFLLAQAEAMADIRGPDVAAALGGLVPDVDKAVITGAFGDFLAESLRSAVRHGIEGWRDDDLAFAAHWGFELAAITVPVAVWQGGADLMVPFAHGSWLAEHVPGARPHLAAEHGHLSLLVGNVEAILGDLVGLGESAGAR